MLAAAKSDTTRGATIIAAIEATYKEVVREHPATQRSGLFAGTRPTTSRRKVEDPRKLIATISEEEAEILAEVVARTTLSLSGFVDEALVRWGDRSLAVGGEPTSP